MTSIAQTLTLVSPHRLWLRLTPVQKRLLSWSLLFATVVTLFCVIARVDELRSFDVVFWPMAGLCFVVTLSFGLMVGQLWGLRQAKRQSAAGSQPN